MSSGTGWRGGTVEGAEAFLDALVSRESFDRLALEGVKARAELDVRFEPGRCVCRFPVRASAQNRYGTLHGGCIATAVDVISTAALVTVSPDPGVSADLSVRYLSPGPGSEDVEIDARVLKVGKSLAFMEVTVSTLEGKTVARGSHTKFLPGTGSATRARL